MRVFILRHIVSGMSNVVLMAGIMSNLSLYCNIDLCIVSAPQAKVGKLGMEIGSWLGGAKHKAKRECTEAKRRVDSAKPNPKGAQASARERC